MNDILTRSRTELVIDWDQIEKLNLYATALGKKLKDPYVSVRNKTNFKEELYRIESLIKNLTIQVIENNINQ